MNMELVEMGYVYRHEATTFGQRECACCRGWESWGKYIRITLRLHSPLFETPEASSGKRQDGVIDTLG